MPTRVRAWPLIALLGLCPSWAQAQPWDGGAEPAAQEGGDAPTVGASLDRVEAHVGDRLTLTVSAIARAAVAASLRLPAPLSLGKFEVLDAARSDRDLGEGKFSRRFVLQIAAYETGELEVPAIPLAYEGAGGARQVGTAPIPVRIKSLIGEEGSADLQPLKPPRPVLVEDDRPWRLLRRGGMGLGGALLLLVFIVTLRRLRRRIKLVVPAPPVPSHARALRRLADLRRRGDFARDGFRPFFFELAEILRAYLGGRFAFAALELTTSELLAELGRRGVSLASRIAAFLEESDLVKFAQAPSNEARAAAALAEVEFLVLTLGAPIEEAVAPAREVRLG